MFEDLLAALALALVLEGILPFARPDSARRIYEMLGKTGEQSLRTIGLTCMLIGCVLLLVVRS